MKNMKCYEVVKLRVWSGTGVGKVQRYTELPSHMRHVRGNDGIGLVSEMRQTFEE